MEANVQSNLAYHLKEWKCKVNGSIGWRLNSMNYQYTTSTLSLSHRKEEDKNSRNKVVNHCCITMMVISLHKGMEMGSFVRHLRRHKWITWHNRSLCIVVILHAHLEDIKV